MYCKTDEYECDCDCKSGTLTAHFLHQFQIFINNEIFQSLKQCECWKFRVFIMIDSDTISGDNNDGTFQKNLDL